MMQPYPLETGEHWNATLNPSWGATLLSVLVGVLVPLVAMVLVSYPAFGAGLIVGVGLLYSVQAARRILGRLLDRNADSLWPSPMKPFVRSASRSK